MSKGRGSSGIQGCRGERIRGWACWRSSSFCALLDRGRTTSKIRCSSQTMKTGVSGVLCRVAWIIYFMRAPRQSRHGEIQQWNESQHLLYLLTQRLREKLKDLPTLKVGRPVLVQDVHAGRLEVCQVNFQTGHILWTRKASRYIELGGFVRSLFESFCRIWGWIFVGSSNKFPKSGKL